MIDSVLGTACRSRGSNAHVDLAGVMGCGSLVGATVMRASASGAIAICIKLLAAAVGENGWLLDWGSWASSIYVCWR